MALPSDNGIFIHKGINCTPNYVPTAQSIPMSPTDNTSVKNKIDTKSDLSNIANTYNPTDTYAEDDCVIYEGVLYQCVNSSGTTGTWVPADWTPVKAVDVGSGGGGGSSSASHVSYNNTIVTPASQRLSGTNVQDAIDEVVERVWEGTLAQYNAIPVKDPNTVYYVTDAVAPVVGALAVSYDNSISELSATNVQSAIDELAQGGGGGTAATTTYDNTESGLSADNVQEAIDEVVADKADRVALPAEYDSTATYNVGDFCTHDNNIYLCSNKITTPEVWTSNHWTLCNAQQDYLHSLNPVGNGSFSLNRKNGTTIGELSFAGGANVTASGYISHAEGNNTVASGSYSHAEGFVTTASGSYSHAEGGSTTASGAYSHAEGSTTTASGIMAHAEGGVTQAVGWYSHTEGYYTKAKHKSQHVFGEWNVADPSTMSASNRGTYVEIIGNGIDDNARSNARTLDWSGNEVLSGGLKINGTQNVATQVSLTQAEYDALVSAGTVDLVNTIYFITDANATACSASEVTYSNTSSGLSATNVQGAIDELESGKENALTYETNDYNVATYGGVIRCKKWGRVVNIQGYGLGTVTNMSTVQAYTMATIASKYRPITQQHIIGSMNAGSYATGTAQGYRINSDGTVVTYVYSGTKIENGYFNVTFII